MSLNPCLSLSFDGRCEDALNFYAQALHGKVVFLLHWGDSGNAGEVPAEWQRKVFHARIRIGGARLSFPGGRRDRHDAVARNVLVATLRCGQGPVRHRMGYQLRGSLDYGGSRKPGQWLQRFLCGIC